MCHLTRDLHNDVLHIYGFLIITSISCVMWYQIIQGFLNNELENLCLEVAEGLTYGAVQKLM
jgi:hypothetical protein